MDLRYGVDDIPPARELVLFGLQWLAIALPGILIIGRVIGGLQFSDYAEQVLFLQKSCFVVAITMAVQIVWGHKLPLVAGPSAVLLVGAVASQDAPYSAVYTAILVGGLLLTLVSASGLFRHLQRLFTPRVVATVLLLIAFTLTPTILRLLIPAGPIPPLWNLIFSFLLILLLFVAYVRLTGIWRSTLIVWGLVVGTLAHGALFGFITEDTVALPVMSGLFHTLAFKPVFDPGVLLAFLFCFIALAVNDLGSIQSVGEVLRTPEMPPRVRRGITVTGLANVVSGLFGVLGPVNFSLSPGVIAASGCASRFTLLPAAFLLLLLAFSPAAVAWVGLLPDVVIGSVLLYILVAQVAAGLAVVCGGAPFQPRHGLIVGLPLLLGTMLAFLPPEIVGSFPPVLRPIIGNGFVVGTAAVLLMEHVILHER